jgi:plasmid maintenance system antidote protein VapI
MITDDSADLLTNRPRQKSPDSKLRKARLARKFSQADLAVVSGVSVSWVSMLERRPELLSPDVAQRLARALGATAEELLAATPLRSQALASAPPAAGVCLSTPPSASGIAHEGEPR